MPPGAALPYLLLHCAFDQIGIETFCRTAGCGPSGKTQTVLN